MRVNSFHLKGTADDDQIKVENPESLKLDGD